MVQASTLTLKTYPQETELGDKRKVTLRLMERWDRDRIVEFARGLPPEDLLFLRKDITNPAVVDGWVHDLEIGLVQTVVAEAEDELIGYGSLWLEETFWGRHMAEIRVLVRPDYRGVGLGYKLASDVFAIARYVGINKIIARVTREQKRTRARMERLGFRREAMLRGFAVDREGNRHDLVVMSTERGYLTDAEERASWRRS
jgi:RimJ/RimL family protein N-acetyltransferase